MEPHTELSKLNTSQSIHEWTHSNSWDGMQLEHTLLWYPNVMRMRLKLTLIDWTRMIQNFSLYLYRGLPTEDQNWILTSLAGNTDVSICAVAWEASTMISACRSMFTGITQTCQFWKIQWSWMTGTFWVHLFTVISLSLFWFQHNKDKNEMWPVSV